MNKQNLKLLLKIIGSALLLFYSLNKVPFSSIKSGFQYWDIGLLFFGFIIALSTVFFQALRWKVLMNKSVDVKLIEYMKFTFMGYYYNLLAPISIGGELLKANSFGNKISNKGSSIASAIQAKFLGVFVLFILGFSLGQTTELQSYMNALLSICLLTFFITIMPVWWNKKWTKPIFKSRFENIQIWLNGEHFNWGDWFKALGLSLIIQLLNGIVHWFYFTGIGADLSIGENFLYFPWLPIIMMLPVALWGVGLKESYSLNTLASLDGVNEVQCIQSSIASYLLVLAFGLIGFIVYAKTKKSI